jgi:putative lipoprotein
MFVSRLLCAGLMLLGLLLLAPAATADDVTFTGEVTYRERIALPPRAELWVTLVSLPRATPVVSAAANVGSGQVPLQYTLDVRSDVIATGGSYGLVAEIRAEGRTLFRNSQPVPVDVTAPLPTLILVNFSPDPPHDAPEQVLPPERPIPLLDTAWRVIGIGGDPVLADTEVTLTIAADLRAGGNGGCNSYFTEADFEGPPLTFGPIAGTRMACTPEVMTQEADLFAALGATVGYELAGNSLVLVDAAGVPLIELVREQ